MLLTASLVNLYDLSRFFSFSSISVAANLREALGSDPAKLFFATVEFAFGWYCLLIRSRQTRLGLVSLYAAFTLISLLKALTGEQHCGCFGSFSPSPWTRFVIDGALTAALALTPETSSLSPLKSAHAKLSCIGLITALMLAGFSAKAGAAIAADRPSFQLASPLTHPKNLSLVLDNWAGRELPLLQYIPSASDRRFLSLGDVTAILFRGDCVYCLAELPYHIAKVKAGERRAIILVGPVTPGVSAKLSAIRSIPLTQNRRFLTQTPMLLHLKDGVVLSCYRGGPSDPRDGGR